MADWRSELLTYIGAPRQSTNLQAIDLWARSEAQPSSKHNPLGARPFDDDKQEWASQDAVLAFSDIQRATAYYSHLLHQERFLDIHLQFRSGGALWNIWSAIHADRWRPLSYQTGHYPVLLYRIGFSPQTSAAPPAEPINKLAHDIFHAWHGLSQELHHHTPRQIAAARHWARRMHSAVR